jgi:hypothetical protein
MCGHGIDALGASVVPQDIGRIFCAAEIFCLVHTSGHMRRSNTWPLLARFEPN